MMERHFSVDARAMLTWGRESIKDHTTAILELVKNSYDAEASVVEVEIRTRGLDRSGPFIRVADDGVGMSASDIQHYWLRLGYSSKLQEKFARGRRKTGEKGIGRISADRLGAILELRSQKELAPAIGLRVDWRDFERPGRDIQLVPIGELEDLRFKVPRPSKWNKGGRSFDQPPAAIESSRDRPGTELMIRELRQQWDADDIAEMRRLLSLLTPPFREVTDFQIRLSTDIHEESNGVVTSPFFSAAAIEADLVLGLDGVVKGTIARRKVGSRKRVVSRVSMPFDQLVHPKSRAVPLTPASLGPVRVQLFFYPNKAETLEGLELGRSDLREFLQANAGIRIYRDNIRVQPYGDPGRPEGDWLGLGERKTRNPAGANRRDFRVSPYQLVGAAFIGRDSNPGLADTSGREGFVDGQALRTLRSFLLGCIVQLEVQYHQWFVRDAEAAEVHASPRATVANLRAHLSELASNLKRAETAIPAGVRHQMSDVVVQLESLPEKLRVADKSLEELGSQAVVSRTLATIGIATATFGHETQRGLDSMRATLEAALLLLRNGDDQEEVLSEVQKALTESEQVSAWGAFALGRVRGDKRTRRVLDVAGLVGAVLDEITPAVEASSITLKRDLKSVRAKVFPMDVECVVINLLTNAYYFAKQGPRERRISVRLRPRAKGSKTGFELTVGDSGPGVSRRLRERIWEPLFSTKTDEGGKLLGTGLGLALVSAVVQDVDGERSVETDPSLGGARFSVWLPGVTV